MLNQPPMRYQNAYVWLLLLSALDIMLTWIVLELGGREENLLAAQVLHVHGPRALVVYKFTLIIFVILMCEFVGRLRDGTGRKLAYFALAVNCIPVIWSLGILLRAWWEHHDPDLGGSFQALLA